MILTVSLLLHIMILYGKRNGGLRLTNLQLERLWLCFLTYSCLGWIIEVLFVLFTGGGLTNRGFLLGPYCPIYGVGCLTILVLTGNLARKPLRFIFSAMIICGIWSIPPVCSWNIYFMSAGGITATSFFKSTAGSAWKPWFPSASFLRRHLPYPSPCGETDLRHSPLFFTPILPLVLIFICCGSSDHPLASSAVGLLVVL